MEQPTDVQDVRVVHFGLGSLGRGHRRDRREARRPDERRGLSIRPPAVPAAISAEVAGLGSGDRARGRGASARLRDIEADVVLFAPEGDLDAATTDLEILLEVGLNVVAILPELAYPPDDDDDDLAVSIDTLAREAEVTVLALDPSDALLGTLPLILTGAVLAGGPGRRAAARCER